jgi:hypothetical protein
LRKNIAIVSSIIIALIIIPPFLRFLHPILSGNVDYYQTQQTQMAEEFLVEQLNIQNKEIKSGGGSAGGQLYSPFEIDFTVGDVGYTVIHENSELRSLFKLKGQMRIESY